MAAVFDLLRALAEYWFQIKNGISWGHILIPKKTVPGVNNTIFIN